MGCCQKNWKPNQYSKVCSDHFLTGKPSHGQLFDFDDVWHIFIGKPVRGPLHPDYVPSVFSYTVKSTVAKPPSARDPRALKRSERTRVCCTTSGTKLPVNQNGEQVDELAESGEQVDDAELAESGGEQVSG